MTTSKRPQPSHYELLGITEDFPSEAIRSLRSGWAKKHHPDNGSQPDAALMSQINHACDVLGDPYLRSGYDKELAAKRRSTAGRTHGQANPHTAPPPPRASPPPPPRASPPPPPRASPPPPPWGGPYTPPRPRDRRQPEHDPFGRPQAPASSASGARAGFWLRFAAALIDSFILVFILAVPSAVVALSAGLAASYAVWLLGSIAYATYYEGGRRGQTIGKRVAGIRVVELATGGSLGHRRAFVRCIGRPVSALVLYIGYLWMLFDPEKQTWHDKMAGSVVILGSGAPIA